jgi:hypothetical protein
LRTRRGCSAAAVDVERPAAAWRAYPPGGRTRSRDDEKDGWKTAVERLAGHDRRGTRTLFAAGIAAVGVGMLV